MLKIKIKPITEWIGTETKYPKRSQFKQTYANTKKILEFELDKLGALESSLLIEMFINDGDLRNDGELRANARPYRQGVRLSFTRISRRLRNQTTGDIRNETQTLSYPCDAFDDWQDNLRAIALSLEALRKVERYGVFKYEDMVSRLALPAAADNSREQNAYLFLAKYSGCTLSEIAKDAAYRRKAFVRCLQKLHPDNPRGDNELFLKLYEIKNFLGM